MSSTNVLIYVDLISNKQSIFSNQIRTPSFPINWLSLISTARSPIILWRDSDLIMINLRIHDSNKYQTNAFVICDHKSHQTRSATYVNKTYLVWLMYWLLFNQHYQHRTIKSRVRGQTQFFKTVGFAGKRFLLSPPSPPSFPFCALVPTFSTNSRGNACHAG